MAAKSAEESVGKRQTLKNVRSRKNTITEHRVGFTLVNAALAGWYSRHEVRDKPLSTMEDY